MPTTAEDRRSAEREAKADQRNSERDAKADLRELSRQLENVAKDAAANLKLTLALVSPLKDVGFARWIKQLKREAERQSWPEHILSEGDPPDLTQSERDALDLNKVDDLRKMCHIRNAYTVITNSCDGHQLQSKLEDIPHPRARQAMDCVRNSLFPQTASGRQIANTAFNNATMESSRTNMTQWCAKVKELGNCVRRTGGVTDDNAVKGRILQGLLGEFSDIGDRLLENETLSLADTILML